MIQIICPACKQLVEVQDLQVVSHNREDGACPGSGMRYISVNAGARQFVAPGVERIASASVEMDCGCRIQGQLLRVHRGAIQKASVN